MHERRSLLILALVAATAAYAGCHDAMERSERATHRITRDTVEMIATPISATGAGRAETADAAAPPAIAPEAPPSISPDTRAAADPPDAVEDGRPLLVVVYGVDELELLNFGDVIPLDPVMGYVGEEVGGPGAVDALRTAPDPWVNRLEWASDAEAYEIVRDTAARLGIGPGDTYWVVGPDGPVPAVVAAPRPGQNECGRPGGIAVALEGDAAALPPGAYYATADRAAAARTTTLPPEPAGRDTFRAAVAALDVDGDGAVDTWLTRSGLLQRREGGRAYVARDPRVGRC